MSKDPCLFFPDVFQLGQSIVQQTFKGTNGMSGQGMDGGAHFLSIFYKLELMSDKLYTVSGKGGGAWDMVLGSYPYPPAQGLGWHNDSQSVGLRNLRQNHLLCLLNIQIPGHHPRLTEVGSASRAQEFVF